MKTMTFGLFLAMATTASAVETLPGHPLPVDPMNPMETFVQCHSAHPVPDTSDTLVIRQARIGTEMDAVYTTFFLGHNNSTQIRNVRQSARMLHAVAIEDIYTAQVRNGLFSLTIDKRRADEQGFDFPAVMELGSYKADLLCQYLMRAL